MTAGFPRLLAILGLISIVASTQGARVRPQSAASVNLRVVLEGTWVLDEWYVDGKVLRPPQVDGRRANHDGTHLFIVHRETDGTSYSQVGYGVYKIDANSWSYMYERMETTTGPTKGPFQVTVSRDPELRPFKISWQGTKLVLEGADEDRRVYDGQFLTFMQKGQIVRKWRRVN